MLKKAITHNTIIHLVITVICFFCFFYFFDLLRFRSTPADSHHQTLDPHNEQISAIIKQASAYLQFRLTQNDRMKHPHRLAMIVNIDRRDIASVIALCHYAQDHGVTVFFSALPGCGNTRAPTHECPYIRLGGYDIIMTIRNHESTLRPMYSGMVFQLPLRFYT